MAKLQCKYDTFIEFFSKEMPDATTELIYENPFQLLVAVILSAQCTDKKVNEVTPLLFKSFPTAEKMAEADFEEIEHLVHGITYSNSKSRHLIGMAKILISDFGGEVPSDFDQLTSLPGVGRKTANVIQSVVFGKATMAVDTHVFRVSRRIGLVPERCTTPLSVEKHLTKHIPEEHIPRAHHWLILHGRYICKAQRPKCDECGITEICSYFNKKNKESNKKNKQKK